MRLRSDREARIHAHICGDGHLYVEEGKRGKRYVIEYTNTHAELVNEFIRDAINEYKVSPSVIIHKGAFIVRFKSKYAFNRLKQLGAGKSREWRAPIQIFYAEDRKKTTSLIRNWLRAFFDYEAYIDMSTKRIVVTSVNYYGLLDVRDMLTYLNIDCKVYTIMKGYAYRLVVSGKTNISKFVSNIVLLHSLKTTRLKQIISSHKHKI